MQIGRNRDRIILSIPNFAGYTQHVLTARNQSELYHWKNALENQIFDCSKSTVQICVLPPRILPKNEC